MTEPRWCEDKDCDLPVHSRGRYCGGHAKQIQRHGRIIGPLREQLSLPERCLEKAIDVVNADSDDEDAYERARNTLMHALIDWADYLRGSRGGKARAKAMTRKEKKESARHAALALAKAMTPKERERSARRAAKARAAALSPEQRRAIAQRAAKARWAAKSTTSGRTRTRASKRSSKAAAA